MKGFGCGQVTPPQMLRPNSIGAQHDIAVPAVGRRMMAKMLTYGVNSRRGIWRESSG